MSFLQNKGISLEASAVVELETESYMLGFKHGVRGLIVTQGHQFFAFELELDESHMNVTSVLNFQNITREQNMSRSNPGTGVGRGALAVEVLSRLSAP